MTTKESFESEASQEQLEMAQREDANCDAENSENEAAPGLANLTDEQRAERRQMLEALILGAGESVSSRKLAAIVPDGTTGLIRTLVDELNAEYAEQGRAFEICCVAGGFELRTRPEFAKLLQQLKEERPLRLSRAALETLAIVAYRQPITRTEIEQIRGVDAGAVLRTMAERKLLRIAGHRDVPGKPMLYATNKRFLEVFGLNSLGDLPSLRDLKELAAEEQQELDLETGALERVMSKSDLAVCEEESRGCDGPQPATTQMGEGDSLEMDPESLEFSEAPSREIH